MVDPNSSIWCFRFGPHLRLKTPSIRWALPVLLGNGYLGRRVATAFSRWNEVWLHRFPSLPFGSPLFIPFPLTHFFFPSFPFTWLGSALSVHAQPTFNSGFRSPRSSQSHVLILLSYCAYTHTFVLTLVLLASPRGGVCVCTPWNHRDPVGLFCFLVLFQQGRVTLLSYHTQRSCG